MLSLGFLVWAWKIETTKMSYALIIYFCRLNYEIWENINLLDCCKMLLFCINKSSDKNVTFQNSMYIHYSIIWYKACLWICVCMCVLKVIAHSFVDSYYFPIQFNEPFTNPSKKKAILTTLLEIVSSSLAELFYSSAANGNCFIPFGIHKFPALNAFNNESLVSGCRCRL